MVEEPNALDARDEPSPNAAHVVGGAEAGPEAWDADFAFDTRSLALSNDGMEWVSHSPRSIPLANPRSSSDLSWSSLSRSTSFHQPSLPFLQGTTTSVGPVGAVDPEPVVEELSHDVQDGQPVPGPDDPVRRRFSLRPAHPTTLATHDPERPPSQQPTLPGAWPDVSPLWPTDPQASHTLPFSSSSPSSSRPASPSPHTRLPSQLGPTQWFSPTVAAGSPSPQQVPLASHLSLTASPSDPTGRVAQGTNSSKLAKSPVVAHQRLSLQPSSLSSPQTPENVPIRRTTNPSYRPSTGKRTASGTGLHIPAHIRTAQVGLRNDYQLVKHFAAGILGTCFPPLQSFSLYHRTKTDLCTTQN